MSRVSALPIFGPIQIHIWYFCEINRSPSIHPCFCSFSETSPTSTFVPFQVCLIKLGNLGKQNKTVWDHHLEKKPPAFFQGLTWWSLHTNPNFRLTVNLIAAALFYSWEDKQAHNYSPNKQVVMMYRIKECADNPLGRERHIVAFCLWGFKTEQLLTPPNKASLLENLIMTRNDKFTLCNYLLPFQSSILWGEDSACAWLAINLVR